MLEYSLEETAKIMQSRHIVKLVKLPFLSLDYQVKLGSEWLHCVGISAACFSMRCDVADPMSVPEAPQPTSWCLTSDTHMLGQLLCSSYNVIAMDTDINCALLDIPFVYGSIQGSLL